MTSKLQETKQPGNRIRVFLVDDNPAVLRGLSLFLSREPDLEICGSAETAVQALEGILAVEPNVGIIDLTLGDRCAVQLISELRAHSPALKLLAFSMHNKASYIQAAFRAGVDGYVAKEEGTEQLVEALRTVMGGSHFLSPGLAARAAVGPISWKGQPRPSA